MDYSSLFTKAGTPVDWSGIVHPSVIDIPLIRIKVFASFLCKTMKMLSACRTQDDRHIQENELS